MLFVGSECACAGGMYVKKERERERERERKRTCTWVREIEKPNENALALC